MALVTEEMIANAIKDGKTMTVAASEWNVDPGNLKRISGEKMGR